nr:MAG TPA: Putative cell wall binding repeat [Caudoviricetes sp.]
MKRFEIYNHWYYFNNNTYGVNFGSFRFLLIVIDYIVYYKDM